MVDVDVLLSSLPTAKTLLDFINNVFEVVKSKPENVPEGIKTDLLGSKLDCQMANVNVVKVLEARAVPFILRVGYEFNMPYDIDKMEQAVFEKDLWDWTYVYGLKHGDKSKSKLISHLRGLFCDPHDDTSYKRELETTCLCLSKSDMPVDTLGKSICIAGVALKATNYYHIFNLDRRLIFPGVVIRELENKIVAHSDPISTNLFLKKTVDYIFTTYKKRLFGARVLIDKAYDEKRLKIAPEMKAALKV